MNKKTQNPNPYKTPSNRIRCLSKAVEMEIDPVVLYQHLSHDIHNERQLCNRMLLESCAIEHKQQLKSLLMNRAALRIMCNQQAIIIDSLSANGDNALRHLSRVFDNPITTHKKESLRLDLDYAQTSPKDANKQVNEPPLDEMARLQLKTPIDCLRQISRAFTCQASHPYSTFLCGLFSFDFIASFEDLPSVDMGNNQCPDYVFYLAEELLVIDHETQQCQIYSNVFSGNDHENQFYEQSRRVSQIAERVAEAATFIGETCPQQKASTLAGLSNLVSCDLSERDYAKQVVQLKQHIVAGDIFQVVPSRSFSMTCKDKLLAYKHLSQSNPSPYLFYLEDQDFALFGASPESALKFQANNRRVELYPIAGTRYRGVFTDGSINEDLDARLETELKLDQKEVAEHIMLVDLARNDISRISQQGSIKIPRLMQVDRYSHVMHLVSRVEGKLQPELDCFHAYQACMNMGTLTGAPKIKATELIRLTEGKRRGSYGGAVGYINSNGDMDTCIVIRSAYCQDGIAFVQAGAGVVQDSDPLSEAMETQKKANAVLEAIHRANGEIERGRAGNKQDQQDSRLK